MDPRKVMNCDDLCREFLCQYSYKLPITLRDLELINEEQKEEFSDYLTRWRRKLLTWWIDL